MQKTDQLIVITDNFKRLFSARYINWYCERRLENVLENVESHLDKGNELAPIEFYLKSNTPIFIKL